MEEGGRVTARQGQSPTAARERRHGSVRGHDPAEGRFVSPETRYDANRDVPRASADAKPPLEEGGPIMSDARPVCAAAVCAVLAAAGCGGGPAARAAEAGEPQSFRLTSGLYRYTTSDSRGIDKGEVRLVREGDSVRIVEYDSEWPGKGRLKGLSFALHAADEEIDVRLDGRLIAHDALEGTVMVTSPDGSYVEKSTFRLEKIGPVTAPWSRPPSEMAP